MKHRPELPEDDLPPSVTTLPDRILQRQLEESIEKYFYQACDHSMQALLSKCEWYVTTNAKSVTLVIECPDTLMNWRVLKNLVKLGATLQQFASARIRVCPPPGPGTPFEMRVDELSVYRDSI